MKGESDAAVEVSVDDKAVVQEEEDELAVEVVKTDGKAVVQEADKLDDEKGVEMAVDDVADMKSMSVDTSTAANQGGGGRGGGGSGGGWFLGRFRSGSKVHPSSSLAPHQRLFVSPQAMKWSLNVLRFGIFADSVNSTILQPNFPIMVLPGAHPVSEAGGGTNERTITLLCPRGSTRRDVEGSTNLAVS